jgi:hypothetical protein
MVAAARWWLLVALGGCLADDPVQVGFVAWASVPTTVGVGEDFTVVVTTEGTPCETAASTDVAVSGPIVDITPYDHIAEGGCVLLLTYYTHSVVLSLDAPGPAEVRVHTRAGNLSSPGFRAYPITVE